MVTGCLPRYLEKGGCCQVCRLLSEACGSQWKQKAYGGGVPHHRPQAGLPHLFSSPVHSGTTDHPSSCGGVVPRDLHISSPHPAAGVRPHPAPSSGHSSSVSRPPDDCRLPERGHERRGQAFPAAPVAETQDLDKSLPQPGIAPLRPAFLPCLLRGPGSCCSCRTLPTSVLIDKLPSLVPKLWVGTEETLRHSLGLRYVAFSSCPPLAILSCDPRS